MDMTVIMPYILYAVEGIIAYIIYLLVIKYKDKFVIWANEAQELMVNNKDLLVKTMGQEDYDIALGYVNKACEALGTQGVNFTETFKAIQESAPYIYKVFRELGKKIGITSIF